MSKKLTTNKIQKLISKWVDVEELKPEIFNYCDSMHKLTDSQYREFLDETAESFSFTKGCSVEDLKNYIWSLWTSPSEWEEVEKELLSESWEDYFLDVYSNPEEPIPYFMNDVINWCDKDLLQFYCDNHDQAEECIHRTFEPKNRFGESYRMEVISSPEDDKIVGWVIIVD